MNTRLLIGSLALSFLVFACGKGSQSPTAGSDADKTDTVAMLPPGLPAAAGKTLDTEENTAAEAAQIARFEAMLAEAERRSAQQSHSRSRSLGGDLLGEAEALSLTPKTDDGTTWGFADAAGNYVVKPQFVAVKTFAEGLAPVQTPQKKWGFINLKGIFVIAPRFDRVQVTGFQEGRVIAVASDTFGYINTAGKYIDGYFSIQKKGKKKKKP